MRRMDKVDLQLIKILSQNSRLTYRELAEMLGTTRQRVARKVDKLKKLGIIRKFTIIPNLEKLNYMYAILLIKVKATENIYQVAKVLKDHEDVKILELGLGKYNIIAHVLVPKDIKKAQEKVNDVIKEINGIEDLEVEFVSDIPKFELL